MWPCCLFPGSHAQFSHGERTPQFAGLRFPLALRCPRSWSRDEGLTFGALPGAMSLPSVRYVHRGPAEHGFQSALWLAAGSMWEMDAGRVSRRDVIPPVGHVHEQKSERNCSQPPDWPLHPPIRQHLCCDWPLSLLLLEVVLYCQQWSLLTGSSIMWWICYWPGDFFVDPGPFRDWLQFVHVILGNIRWLQRFKWIGNYVLFCHSKCDHVITPTQWKWFDFHLLPLVLSRYF